MSPAHRRVEDGAPSGISRRRFLGGVIAAASALALHPRRALASADAARELSFVHLHTGERLAVAYRNGSGYEREELARVDHFLRDFRTGERHPIDTALLDLLHELKLATGTSAPFQVISGYRSPRTNEALRAQGGGQARNSFHLQGRAIDVRLADVESRTLRNFALALARGGVGYYPAEDFVHVDTGPVRRW